MHLKSTRRSLLLTGILTFGMLFGAAVTQLSFRAFAENEDGPEEDRVHVISFYADGKYTNVRTDAETVRDALLRANINLSEGDEVEPALDEQITSDGFNINIYRARDVVVLDGARKIHIKSASTNPETIVVNAGVELLDADKVELVNYNGLLESGSMVAYQVKRAKTAHVDYYGKQLDLRTQAKTVADLLKEQKIDSDTEKNWISVPLKTKLSDGISFSIMPQGVQTITTEEAIAFDEKVVQDYDLEYGKRQLVKAGENGSKTVTYEVDMKDGVELSRKKISEIITKEPVTQEVKVGQKVSLPSGSHEDWMAAAGIAASDYGYVNYIISHESSWRPNATNGRYWGLYQTSQARLISDCGSDWVNDPVCQLRSATGYAVGRYGSWESAYNKWRSQGWW